jgi:outer membrane protein OmpA-like peptidoglycan-associated protein
MMLSHDQLKELEYDGAGFIANVAVSRELISRLSLQWSARGGTFLSKQQIGGLVGTLLGLRLHPTERDVMPYLSVDVGMAVTGADVRPWVAGAVGIDCRINERWQAGPVAGVDDVIQWNGEAYSTDAMFLWFGLGFSYRTRRARPPPPPPASTHTVVHTREVVQLPSEPEPGETLVLEHLIERALGPSRRVELLAPVLFALDSDQLEPVGVAMLHEVARTLATRPEILLLEVQGYADARGSDAHNRALSQRRAERVRDWLIEHGVAPDRLTVAPQGESAPVESDESESAYQQNRRVVFRVLELAEP